MKRDAENQGIFVLDLGLTRHKLQLMSSCCRRLVTSGSRSAENDVLLGPGMNAAAVLTGELLSF